MKKYSIAYWIKQKLSYVSKPEDVIVAAVRKHYATPDESDIAFDGLPIELINALYLEWKKRSDVHHSLFPTPLPIARELVAFAGIKRGERVFDPGCGFGNLLHAARERGASAFGCEIQEWIARLTDLLGLDIARGDFLDYYHPGQHDVVLMNPPFGRGYQNEKEISDLVAAYFDRIAGFIQPEMRIAAILPLGYVGSERPKARVETLAKFKIVKRKELMGDVFKPLTNICTEMVLLELNFIPPFPTPILTGKIRGEKTKLVTLDDASFFEDLDLWKQSR